MFPDYPFSSKYCHVKGGRLHYIDEGSGPVIVMVHGNPTWSYYYRHLIGLLSSNFRVIAIDHMGCGLSDKPQDYDYSLAQHITNLESLMTNLKVGDFSLIVHDWGGAIGFGVATKQIKNVKKIVVLNTAAFRSTRIPLRINICRLPVVGEIIVRLFNGFAWPATFMAVTKNMRPHVAKAYLAPYDSWANRIAVHRFVKDIPLDRLHPSYKSLKTIEEKLIQIRDQRIPMLILWGGKDFCFNDAFYKEWGVRFPDAEKHYFSDGGHYILEDKKDEIGEIVETFFHNDFQ